MRFILPVLLSTVIVLAGKTITTEPFSPEFVDPILNQSNWHLIEPLNEIEVYCGAEDSTGNLWFGSMDGLYIYDGYGCHKITYPSNFQNLKVYQLYIDENDHVYLSTNLALLKYKNDEWITLKSYHQTRNISKQAIQKKQDGQLLVVSGETIFVIEDEILTPLIAEDSNINDYLLFKNQIWIFTQNEINCYDFKNDSLIFKRRYFFDNIPQAILNKEIIRFTSDGVSEIWLLGHSKIKLYFDFQKQKFTPANMLDFAGENHLLDGEYINNNDLIIFGKNITLKRSLRTWTILDVEKTMPNNNTFHFLRKNGNMIVGGIGVDLFEIDYSHNRWTTIKNIHFQCQDREKNKWFLHENGSIIQFIVQTQNWVKHTGDFISVPTSINSSTDGTIWVSGFHQNQPAVSFIQNNQWHTHLHPSISPKIHYLSFLEKENGEIIFGGTGENNDSGGTITYFNKSNRNEFRRDRPPQTSPVTTQIAKTSESLWFAGPSLYQLSSAKGLESVQIANSTATWIDSLVTDEKDNVWIGLWQDGLYKWDGMKWEHFTKPKNISSDNVVNLAYDRNHNKLWVGHRKGVSLLLPEHDQWIPNAITDNINLQREAATLKLEQSGKLWINSTVRRWYLRKDNSKPDQSFHSKCFTPDHTPPLVWIRKHEKEIMEPANILISWHGIDYKSMTKQEELTYSYRIDDSPWSAFSTQHSKIFLNITPGKHLIQVRCRDLDGNICETPAISHFEIKTMITKRPWFIATFIITILLIFSLIALLIYQRFINLIRLEEIKLQFFTNISHELRSPLTVILGPLESFLKENNHEGISLAHRSALKMLKLVDQILEFRKIEMGKVEHRFVHGNIIDAIRETTELFRPIAEKKNQNFIFSYSTENHNTWFDGEKIEKIVDNLLTNASKYSPENGEISMRILIQNTSKRTHNLEILVEDNGIGIPENRINQIFEPYERLRNKHSIHSRGTGLGLSFVKTLVESLDGTIEVTSPVTVKKGEPCGTKFKVTIPLNLNQPDAIPDENHDFINDKITHSEPDQREKAHPRNHILLVEDDADILNYLSMELQKEFEISKSTNGRNAIKRAIKTPPDIIITDVMMPHIDGRQLCEKIKSTPETSHIPVIMLTALKSSDHEVHGLKKGADDYLTKPVNIDVLKQRIHKQLSLRTKNVERNTRESTEKNLKTDHNSSQGNAFIDQFYEKINESFQNPIFDVEMLSKEMGMSRNTLYRKIKSLTDQTPKQHIVNARMTKAKRLLEEGKYNISEISDQAGFHEVSYFSTAFKKQFECSPKEYRERQSKR